MNKEEFDRAVKGGRQLVLLDHVVLDIGDFITAHPGGAFAMKHNIGRDVRKFFYGGYSLDGNLGAVPARGYAHSWYAKEIVNQLIVAVFEPETNYPGIICKVDQKKTERQNESTAVVFLKNTNGVAVPNFKGYH